MFEGFVVNAIVELNTANNAVIAGRRTLQQTNPSSQVTLKILPGRNQREIFLMR